MRKSLLSLLAIAVLSTSAVATAATLGGDMKDIAGIYKSLDKAKSGDEMSKMLTDMRAKVEDAKTHTPEKAQQDVAGYHAQMDKLIGQIDSAKKLADEGKLVEAKAVATEMAATRNEGHSKYK